MFAYSESEKKYINVSMLKSLDIKQSEEELIVNVIGEYNDGNQIVMKSFHTRFADNTNYALQKRQLDQLQQNLDIDPDQFTIKPITKDVLEECSADPDVKKSLNYDINYDKKLLKKIARLGPYGQINPKHLSETTLSFIKTIQIRKEKDNINSQIKSIKSKLQQYHEEALSKSSQEAMNYIMFIGGITSMSTNGVDAAIAGLAVAESALVVSDIIGSLVE